MTLHTARRQRSAQAPWFRESLIYIQFKNNHFTEMCCGTEAGSYLRLIDSGITQLKAQGPSRTCNEEEEAMRLQMGAPRPEVKTVQGYLAHENPPPPLGPP